MWKAKKNTANGPNIGIPINKNRKTQVRKKFGRGQNRFAVKIEESSVLLGSEKALFPKSFLKEYGHLFKNMRHRSRT